MLSNLAPQARPFIRPANSPVPKPLYPRAVNRVKEERNWCAREDSNLRPAV